jgi:hypothetical protein
MVESTNINDAASGLAALSICESLLLAIGDLELNEKEVVGLVADAAEAHRNAGESARNKGLNREAVAILDRIVARGNSMRRPRAD